MSADREVLPKSDFRQGRRVARNVYHGDEPLFMAATDELAAELVLILNAGAAALRAPQNDGAAASEWRPIDSAPMDGTPVWAICMEAQNPTARVSWHGIGWQSVAAFEKFSPAGPARWWPTHWQPLHAPLAQPDPSQEPGTGGERNA